MKSPTPHTERPPIVAVLGHVDHGKSTLLDFIRKSNVVAGEAGGITQHVAAYEVTSHDKRITFIDTPGHAAFSAIRARGANVANIAILVVAADDGVKAQTLEALESIRNAKTPFIVAINKIDKPNADINRTQASLMEKGVYLEKLGGDVPWVAISAKTGTGVDELLHLILLVAEMQEMKGDPSAPARGYVIEAHRDQKRGIAATLVITDGTLESGMAVLAGGAYAPVRIMENHLGQQIKSASFSTPITLIGFDELPQVGEAFQTYKNKRDAEAARETFVQTNVSRAANQKTTERSDRFMLPLIIRADTTGSLEAIVHEVSKLGDEHAGVSIIQSGLGNVSESDVKLVFAATNSTPIIFGFHVGVHAPAETLARTHNIPIERFDIIYKLTERLEEVLKTSTPKRTVEEVIGHARVLKVFSTHKDEHVIGGSVSDGIITRGSHVRILRRKLMIGEGKIKNLQANKQNVEKVVEGTEFGAQVEAPFEIAQGDTLEAFTVVTK